MANTTSPSFLFSGGIKYYFYILSWAKEEATSENIESPQLLATHISKPHNLRRLWANFLDSFPYQLVNAYINPDGTFQPTGEFDTAFRLAIENLELGIDPSVILTAYRDQCFHEELKTLAPDTLFHFIPRQYMLSCFKHKKLVPSTANFYEYYFEIGSKENFDLVQGIFSDTRNNLKNLSITDDFATPIRNSKAPIFNCFTSIPRTSLSFHISHYGSMGIGFKRDYLIEKFRKNLNSKFAPVRYISNDGHTVFSALIEAYKRAKDDPEKKQILTEILFFKALPPTDFKKESFYSSYFEYEWRYVSTEEPFHFEYSDIASIVVDLPTYNLHTQRDFHSFTNIRWISELFNIANKHNIQIIPLEPRLAIKDTSEEILRIYDLEVDNHLKTLE